MKLYGLRFINMNLEHIEQYTETSNTRCNLGKKMLLLTPTGFVFLFRTRPRALGQQTPQEPVLIP